MEQRLEHLVVIGCSAFGEESVKYLVPKLDLTNSGVILIPHILTADIYNSLKSAGVDIQYIQDGVDIQRGKVLIRDEKSRKSEFKIRGGTLGTGCINDVMEDLAKIYQEKCIGVVLSGFGQDSAIGVVDIQRFRGRVLVQVEETDNCERITSRTTESNYPVYYCNSMPNFALNMVTPYFSGDIYELTQQLNGLIGVHDSLRDTLHKATILPTACTAA